MDRTKNKGVVFILLTIILAVTLICGFTAKTSAEEIATYNLATNVPLALETIPFSNPTGIFVLGSIDINPKAGNYTGTDLMIFSWTGDYSIILSTADSKVGPTCNNYWYGYKWNKDRVYDNDIGEGESLRMGSHFIVMPFELKTTFMRGLLTYDCAGAEFAGMFNLQNNNLSQTGNVLQIQYFHQKIAVNTTNLTFTMGADGLSIAISGSGATNYVLQDTCTIIID